MPKCKFHNTKFAAKYFNQKFCLEDDECIKAFTIYAKEETQKKKAREWQKEKKVIKEKLMTKSEHLNLAQKVFNTYIRIRDKGKECISCGKKLGNDFHAGHFFSVGAYPNLRFNENNVHGQCVECNLHKHGNVKEYDLRLQNIISGTEYQNLLKARNEPLKLSIDQVQELIKYYREKTKQLK